MMYLTSKIINSITRLMLIFVFTINAQAAISTFEGLSLPNEQTYLGPGGGNYWSGLVPPANGSVDSSFTSGSASFLNTNNECCGGITFWNGFAYSNTKDTSTPGFGNQYSAITGSGHNSDTYGVGFNDGTRIELTSPTVVRGAYFTNTTFATLSMLNGDSFAKKFGGETGDDADFFNLLITGLDESNSETGTISFALADYTFADNSLDYIIDDWTWVDLTALGNVSAITFSFESSDVGGFGINTPKYFAIDNLNAVPIPASIWFMVSALLGSLRFYKRKD